MKVVTINDEDVIFDDGSVLYSEHDQECCESHYLSFADLSVDDFKGLEFDLYSETFFERVEDYGIRLIVTNGVAIPVPGYGSNNGYYSSNLALVLKDGKTNTCKTFDISDCQVISD
jgi:hypothetical protein